MDEHGEPGAHPRFVPPTGIGAQYGSNGSAEPSEEEIPAATHWPAIPMADAKQEWEELRAWVTELKARFDSVDHHVVPKCWWRHNEHAEALAALRDHERASFSEMAPATAPVDWFRAFRDITALLRTWTGLSGCGGTYPGKRRFSDVSRNCALGRGDERADPIDIGDSVTSSAGLRPTTPALRPSHSRARPRLRFAWLRFGR